MRSTASRRGVWRADNYEDNDAQFIAAAPMLVRDLTAEVEKLLSIIIDGAVDAYKRGHADERS